MGIKEDELTLIKPITADLSSDKMAGDKFALIKEDELTLIKPIPFVGNWFVASVTEDEYDKAIQVVDSHNGWSATGIRSDYLNAKVLQHGWKDGMRAKLTNTCEELTRKCLLDVEYTVAIIIVGGPACDWERWHMSPIPGLRGGRGCPPGTTEEEEHIRSNFPKLRLKACTNAEDMKSFIQRGLPLRECL